MLCALLQFGSIGMGGEQAVAADGANPAQRSAHRLVEALLVAEFIDQIMAGDDDQRRTHHVEPVDRPEFLGQPRQMLDRRGRVQRQHVADHRLGRRMRDRAQFIRGRHRDSLSCCLNVINKCRHCEEHLRSESNRSFFHQQKMDCFALLAMTMLHVRLPKSSSTPFDQLGADLFRLFLLRPMAAVLDQIFFQVGNDLLHPIGRRWRQHLIVFGHDHQ